MTKAGTNQLHGSAYEYNRTGVGHANDWFNKSAELQSGEPNRPGKLVRNTFGGSLGGPLVKDRLYFFCSYEGQRTAENIQVMLIVPSLSLTDGRAVSRSVCRRRDGQRTGRSRETESTQERSAPTPM